MVSEKKYYITVIRIDLYADTDTRYGFSGF